MIHAFTLTWNGQEKLERLHDGLIRNLKNSKQEYQWYIKDNGSKDKTVEITKSWDKTTVLECGHNRDNFATGINVLASAAKLESDDYILLVNNDVEFLDDLSITKMLELMTPEVGIVGAKLLYSQTNRLQHAGVIFGERYGSMPYHYKHQEECDSFAERNRYFQAVTAAVCLIRANDFKAVGGMDQNFHWAFEDIDMCLKIGALGKKIIYCGETKIFHEESATLKKNPVNKLFLSHNVKYFKDKWFGKYTLDHSSYLKDPNYNEIKK
jgi:GT2 family glycosyltransferase